MARNRIGFKPSYLLEENEGNGIDMPPIQQHVVDGPKGESGLLKEAKKRLVDAKVFLISAAYTRLSDKTKAQKVQYVEWLALVVSQLEAA